MSLARMSLLLRSSSTNLAAVRYHVLRNQGESLMHSSSTGHGIPSDVAILARLLGNEGGDLSAPMARHLMTLAFRDDDKARMHELALRNQAGELSFDEKEEMLAYAKAGTLLSILKSRARRVLRVKLKKSPAS